jgi:hypothetical protein
MAYVPAVVGVPARVAVPLPLSVKVSPGGTLDQPKLGAGYPLVVTVKLSDVPARAVALSALVKAGAVPTTTVNDWVALGLTPLLATIVMSVVPVVVGVPEIRAVPLPAALSVKDSPAGSVPDSLIAGTGEPVVVMATAPAWPAVKSAVDALVMMGAAAVVTVIVSARVAVLPEELVAVTVTG